MFRKLQRGFSLIEILIVIAIIAVIATIAVVSLKSFQKSRNLDLAGEEIINTLRLAQSKTLASEGAQSFGVYFSNPQFILYEAGTGQIPPSGETHSLSLGIIISQVNLSGGNQAVEFERLTGLASSTGSIKIELSDDSSKNKFIYIDSSGTISLSSTNPSDTDRLKDSRHVHVLFSQNTKNAASLVLNFPDDSYNETIDFQDYLNADKTSFDWEGVVSVNSVNQRIKIHSHELNDSATMFSINRDRRFNSKALNIFLDGENLINYTASGTTTPGSSVWAGAPEWQ